MKDQIINKKYLKVKEQQDVLERAYARIGKNGSMINLPVEDQKDAKLLWEMYKLKRDERTKLYMGNQATLDNLYSKRKRAGKELKALQWAFEQTGGYNSSNEDSKYLFGLLNKKGEEYEQIDSECVELEMECLRTPMSQRELADHSNKF